jgi:two-component system CheB/CheR fusion protein
MRGRVLDLGVLGGLAVFVYALVRLGHTIDWGPGWTERLAPGQVEGLLAAGIVLCAGLLWRVRHWAQRRRAELLQTNEQLKFLLDSVRESVIATDLRGRVIYWNRGAEALYGWRESEVLGQPVTFMLEPGEDPEESEWMRQVRETGFWSGDYVQKRKDGTRFWAHTLVSFLVDGDGKHAGFIGIERDVTERKKTEEALRESEERLTLAQNAAGIGTWDWVLGEDRAQCSDQYFRLYGLEPSDQMPSFQDWKGRVHPEDRERAGREVDDTLAGRELYNTEYRVVWPDGSVHWLTSRATVLRDENGNPTRMIGAHVDISERKRAEVALEAARKAAESANVAKSEFLANMSHEIRTPMTVITGYTDMLLESDASPQRVEKLMIVKRNAQHLLQLLNDLLDLSKIEADRLEVRRIRFLPMQLLAEVRSLMSLRASEKGLELEIECAGSVPATIYGDPTRLRQILINLVGNAIKFTDAGSVRIVVRLAGSADDARLCLEIIDTGIGMTPEEVGRAFDPFWQVDASPTRRFGGTGLGLSISKRLCVLMGGTIEVESQVGGGTTFRVLIPTGSLEIGTGPGAPSASSALCCHPVLVVARDSEDRKQVEALLSTEGAEVVCADRGDSAIEVAVQRLSSKSPFSLILMGMGLPGLDGCDATRVLRRLGCQARIVALNAGGGEAAARCFEAGCNEVVPLPLDRASLLRLISDWEEPRNLA